MDIEAELSVALVTCPSCGSMPTKEVVSGQWLVVTG